MARVYPPPRLVVHADISAKEQLCPDLRNLTHDWLKERYGSRLDDDEPLLPLNETIYPGGALEGVTSIYLSTDDPRPVFVSPRSCDFHFHVYFPGRNTTTTTISELLGIAPDTEIEQQATAHGAVVVTSLPALSLEGAWEHLVFRPRVQDDILRALVRLLSMKRTAKAQGLSTMLRFGIFLFWGPPGSGKTTLCRALAQKLAIRMPESIWNIPYTQTRLLELDPHSLYSKYFSESAKTVSVTLDAIDELLRKEPDSLIIVLVNEIETLTGTRTDSVTGNEPKDAMRAVNALLTGLDRLRVHANLAVFCTSNLVHAMDPAFIDRVDMKWRIPSPSAEACYEVFRQRLKDLNTTEWLDDVTKSPGADGIDMLAPWETSSMIERHFESTFPGSSNMIKLFAPEEGLLAKQLLAIAVKSQGLSGRTLQRLPMLSLATRTWKYPCPVYDALNALETAVDEEVKSLNASTQPGSSDPEGRSA